MQLVTIYKNGQPVRVSPEKVKFFLSLKGFSDVLEPLPDERASKKGDTKAKSSNAQKVTTEPEEPDTQGITEPSSTDPKSRKSKKVGDPSFLDMDGM